MQAGVLLAFANQPRDKQGLPDDLVDHVCALFADDFEQRRLVLSDQFFKCFVFFHQLVLNLVLADAQVVLAVGLDLSKEVVVAIYDFLLRLLVH